MKWKSKQLSFVLLLVILVSASSCQAIVIVNSGPPNNFRDAGSITAIGGLNTRRAAHTATLLPDGKVLIAGGFTGDENSLASAEVFDPETKSFSSTANLGVSRSGHSATLLNNGKV